MNAIETPERIVDAREQVEFAALHSPGAYVHNENGHLLRVPEGALATDGTLSMEVVSRKPCKITKISDDPWLPISKARNIAADADLWVNF